MLMELVTIPLTYVIAIDKYEMINSFNDQTSNCPK